LYVAFVDGLGVMVDLREREVLAERSRRRS
jgi:hypothetical protein